MSRMRLRTAERLKESQNTTAFLTRFNDVDMSKVMAFRAQNKDDVLQNHGVNLGFMGPVARASALALREILAINSSIENDDTIVYRDYIDLSVAVATPKGLITPACDGKLTMDDLTGGSTISNSGIWGSLFGTPVIINTPQTAVLGIYGIQQRPVAVNGQVEIRPVGFLQGASVGLSSQEDSSMVKQLKATQLIQAYQRWGREYAPSNPLRMANECKTRRKELQLSHYGLSKRDLDLVLTVGRGSVQDFTTEKPKTLWDVIAACEETYCGTMGVERRMFYGPVRAKSWEKFIAIKFPNEKRVGLDGAETYIPTLEAVVDRSAEHGEEKIEMGVAHRGRMNALYNVVGKNRASMFRDFDPKKTSCWRISGDVKYHYGGCGERVTPSGKTIHMSMAPQPSHLESMGGVYETLGLAGLAGYTTGGTLRVIVNNRVGFTTDVWKARSAPYCTDVAKMLDAPVFHVNGVDVEALCSAAILAADFRARFYKECVIDIVCYRRNGHNEMDQASFTQPTMYKWIAKKVHTLDRYEAELIEKSITTLEVDAMKHDARDKLTQSLERTNDQEPDANEWLIDSWKSTISPTELATEMVPQKVTAVDHGDTGKEIDWATAEALALDTLLREGTTVRISGQDVARGTFSQRHAVLHDQGSNQKYTPLSTFGKGQGLFSITDSPLAENAAMGCEYG
ncbi:2-oxoglutarate dehydrogenase E1 component [Aspergillus hancockii]|nr:2-oxoglutarate dehydrogenase E1 component [Aspergillus hancockii]